MNRKTSFVGVVTFCVVFAWCCLVYWVGGNSFHRGYGMQGLLILGTGLSVIFAIIGMLAASASEI